MSFSAVAQDDVLAKMTLEQRIGQLFLVNLYGAQLNEPSRVFLQTWQPGGVVLLGENLGNPEAVTALVNQYQEAITAAGGLPLFVAVDQEPGPISHLREGFTVFPTPTLITATGDADLAQRIGAAMGAELRAVGVNFDFAPIADLETYPDNPIIQRRSFGADPALVSPMVAAFVTGMQSVGVMTTSKHFPGHGESREDSHTSLPIIDLPRERLEAVELAPFRAAIGAGGAAVMVSHIWYPALEAEANLPASLSHAIVTDLLRGEIGFEGLILTDALDMDAIDAAYDYPSAVVAAFQAGVDMVVSAHIGMEAHEAAIKKVAEFVRAGVMDEERINQSVRRVLAAKVQYGVLDWQPLAVEQASQRVQADSHAPLLDELFQKGVTVVRDSALLPVNEAQRLAIIYPATRQKIPRECSAYRRDVQWLGVGDNPSGDEIDAARRMGSLADVLVVFTQNVDDNPAQQDLVKVLPAEKTVVVALFSAYDGRRFPTIAGYIVTYSPQDPAIQTACAVLFGALKPQGKLALTIDGFS